MCRSPRTGGAEPPSARKGLASFVQPPPCAYHHTLGGVRRMDTMRTKRRGLGLLSVLSLAGVGACSTVSPEEMDTSMAAMREEMRAEMQREVRAGDEAVSQ